MKKLPRKPKLKWDPYPEEESGRGVNKWDFLVCQDLGEGIWKRLPLLNPLHISLCRQYKILLSGDLNRPITHIAEFVGVEANYLRAIVARITHATLIGPEDMYEAEEAGDNEEVPEGVNMVEDWEPPESQDALLEATSWVHIRPFLHTQGRVQWMAKPLREKGDDEEEDEEEKEGEEDEEEVEPEPEEAPEVPAICTNIEEDDPLKIPNTAKETTAAWRIEASSKFVPLNSAVVVVRNNLWPGAFAIAKGKTVISLYVGNGYKSDTYQPVLPGKPLDEYAINLVEALDPLPLEEKAAEEKKKAKQEEAEEEAEEEEDEEEGEKEDEEDED
ncbi:hypothetical protein Ciccas_010088 [Cichlidogyrus casuarinus]|uniref:Uncharacterized protein n=1 Tax=Cichlidogyrus casuarinus TaxID=1844966 RepID=A0ABD2PV52_9PLAT